MRLSLMDSMTEQDYMIKADEKRATDNASQGIEKLFMDNGLRT